MFCLEGWDGEFSSVKELTDSLKTFVLKSGSDSFTVKKCCYPRQAGVYLSIFLTVDFFCYFISKYKEYQDILCCGIFRSLHRLVRVSDVELSNLLIMREGAKHCVQTDNVFLSMTQLRFHQIKDKQIKQVKRSTTSIWPSVSPDKLCILSSVTD